MSFFNDVERALPDPVFGMAAAFNADPRPEKINLIMGVYKTPELRTPILASVKRAEGVILAEEKQKDYLPIEGNKEYLAHAGVLLFGGESWGQHAKRIAAVQGIGGTGALRLGADFLKQEVGEYLYYSHPTWVNHTQMMRQVGMKITHYPYYDVDNQLLQFDQMIHFLSELPAKSIVLLQVACHNPTGADPTLAQWKELSDLFLKKKLFPFFDFAYQGFAKGIEEDAAAVRLFLEAGHEMVVANSFSKNFGLYGERVGALFVVTASEKEAENVLSQLKILVRTDYSNPSIHGAKIVSHILGNPSFKAEWEAEVTAMRERIKEMKQALVTALQARSKKRDFNFFNERYGLFSFCGLKKSQVERLIAEYAIYMTGEGRINIAGLNQDNLEYVADAIIQVSE